MYKKTTYKFKPIYCLGDLHGQFWWLKDYIERKDICDCFIIQVGDFGVGFTANNKGQPILVDYKKCLLSLNEFFFKRDIKMFVIRGNHDNPAYFKGNHLYSNIELLKDYTTRTINRKKFLFVGGAISVDRSVLVEGKNYWKDEPFVLDEKKLWDYRVVDVVITHNAPDFIYPQSVSKIVEDMAKNDPALLKDCREERRKITTMWDILLVNNSPSHCFYGHYHQSSSETYKRTRFTLLGISEFKELKL